MTKPLTPQSFDTITAKGPHSVRAPDRIIWTASGIARRLGCGEDYVRRTLARQPGSPIRRKGRRFYAFESDLMAWMRDAA